MPRRMKRAGAKRKPARKLRIKRAPSISQQNQFASTMETVNLQTLTDNSLYQHSFSLGQFPRSSAVAASYKWCRPVEVIWEYTPLYNTFQEQTSGGAGVTVPLFFSYMNRTGNFAGPPAIGEQLDWILSTGARPRTFNKKVVLKYKPNWLSSGLLTAQSTPTGVISLVSMGAKAEFGWVPCPDVIPLAVADRQIGLDPPAQVYVPDTVQSNVTGALPDAVDVSTNGINYQGHYTFIRQAVEGVTKGVAELRVTVKWQFKNPNPQYYKYKDASANRESLSKLIA